MQSQNHESKSPQPCTDIEGPHQATVCPDYTRNLHPEIQPRDCIERKHDQTDPEVFLKLAQACAPSVYEPLSRVLKDRELWERFRQMAAAAFYKRDASYYLKPIASYPLCFAKPKETPYPAYIGTSRMHPFLTFEDLAEIACTVLDGE